MKPAFDVAQVINDHWNTIGTSSQFNTWQLRTLNAIRRCRTAALGGHIDVCTNCNHIRISYNSCRNRHCPKCQQIQRERWIHARLDELLPVPYFHVVFTLPEPFNKLCLYKPTLIYNLLFKIAWSVIQSFGQDPKHLGADTGMICILHTWGQNLSLHPHLHCIVPGGGITKAGYWKVARNKGKYLFPTTSLSTVFRARMVAALRASDLVLDKPFYNSLFKTDWVVHANNVFAKPEHVIEYLGRYTHKIAISNHRILNINNNTVTFSYKDYRDCAKKKIMTLADDEFIRRFALHILPKGFMRIRHYGILSSTRKQKDLPIIYQQLTHKPFVKQEKKDWKQICAQHLNYNPDCCPVCKKETMMTLMVFDQRGPPDKTVILELMKSKTNIAAALK